MPLEIYIKIFDYMNAPEIFLFLTSSKKLLNIEFIFYENLNEFIANKLFYSFKLIRNKTFLYNEDMILLFKHFTNKNMIFFKNNRKIFNFESLLRTMVNVDRILYTKMFSIKNKKRYY